MWMLNYIEMILVPQLTTVEGPFSQIQKQRQIEILDFYCSLGTGRQAGGQADIKKRCFPLNIIALLRHQLNCWDPEK